MRRLYAVIVSFILLLGCTIAKAESWICPLCGNEATGNFCNLCGARSTLDSWTCIQCKNEAATGNFCNNCGAPRPTGSITAEAFSVIPESTPTPDFLTETTVVKKYVGRRLSLCGYTSLGGERRDTYAGTTVLLVMLCPDGTYIDPMDEEELEAYEVIAQFPAATTPFDVTSNKDGSMINPAYGEIVLIVSKTGDSGIEIPEVADVRPSPNKNIQYSRDYRGRTLADVGYTALNGNRYDKYGPDGLVQIVIYDEQGDRLSPSNDEDFFNYVVIDQDIKPNTEMVFYYKNTDSNDYCTGQTIDLIQITVAYSKTARAIMEALAAEEEDLRASGNLIDLYIDTYEIGKDLTAGNYELSLISSSCDVYVYENKEALDNNDGDWKYIYGKGDKEYLYLTDGMYIKISSGAAKAKRSDFSTIESEFVLYTGVYHIGVDLAVGSYEMRPYSSCDVFIYQNETEYAEKKGDWIYLFGKDDVEYINLHEGMVLKISSGASLINRK